MITLSAKSRDWCSTERACPKRCRENPLVSSAFLPLPPFSGSGYIMASAIARWPLVRLRRAIFALTM
jgi:hypothetical protein